MFCKKFQIFKITFLKDTLKAFDDFKNKQQKCLKWCFLMVFLCKSMYILKVCSIYYALK